MTTHRPLPSPPSRRGTARRAGLATLVAGTVLAATTVVAPSASAAANDHQIEMCHATASADHPYSTVSPFKWQIVAPHGHGSEADDIIPPFEAGSQGEHAWDAYEGSDTWHDGGAAIVANGCTPLGSITLDKDTAGPNQPAADHPVAVVVTTTFACDPGHLADQDGTCTPPLDVCELLDGPQSDPALCPAVLPTAVAPVVPAPAPATPATPVPNPALSTTVGAAQLPRTGTEEQALTAIGLGLLLLGTGATLAARQHRHQA